MNNLDKHKEKTINFFEKANVILTDKEKQEIEIAGFGLGDLDTFGLQLITYVNNSRYCAKEMVLFPNQICPEHRHPDRIDGSEGKQETFRCRYGEVHLFVDGGEETKLNKEIYGIPEEAQDYFTVFNKIVLKPGEQYTIEPNTKHWFVARGEGAVVSEFSSNSEDESDIFTDPRVDRTPIQ